jgi:hypothetical protein
MAGSLSPKGVNAQREILSPSADIGKEIKDLRTASPFPNFCRAVVVDVLFDPDSLTSEQLAGLKTKLSNPELLDNVPRNSIIARIVSNAKDRRDSKAIVCYPFFSQHFALPVKPGEQVWVMFEKPEESIRQGFWMSRITEPGHVDDVNFTHADRKYSKKSTQTTDEKAKSKSATASIVRPDFNNGVDKNTQTLQGEGDYDAISKDALASDVITHEPVPRFVKRPGDAFLQGSNNAIIVVGEDRTADASAKPTNPGFAGTVDIVAGRGRFVGSEGEAPVGNAPRTIKNARGNLETDKNPKMNNASGNVAEGNPDMLNDAARVYVSMKTDGDANMGTIPDALPKPFGNLSEQKAAAFVQARADHVRFVARKDVEHGINGSVRIVKEGDVGGDQAALMMESDGTVQLDGKIIYIGRTGGSGPGAEGSEPYIKFSDFKTLMTDILTDLSNFTTSLATSFATNTTPGFGVPCPQLTAASANECATLLGKIQSRIQQIDSVKSERIFGE